MLEALRCDLVACRVDPDVQLTKQQLAEDTLLTPSNQLVRVRSIIEYQSASPFFSPLDFLFLPISFSLCTFSRFVSACYFLCMCAC